MNTKRRRPQLTVDQWEFVRPLIPALPVQRNRRPRIRADREVFAVMAIVVVHKLPWSAGPRYGVSGYTLRGRWLEWSEAGLWVAMVHAVNGYAAVHEWALEIALAAMERAERYGHPVTVEAPASAINTPPTVAEHRTAWAAQNAFPE